MWFFQLSVGVKASTVESKQISFFPLMCLSFWFQFVYIHFPSMFLSFCILFLSCSFHLPFMFLSCSFHLAFKSFHFPSLFIKYAGLRKVRCSNRSGGYPPKRSRFHHILLLFFLSCCYRFGGLCRLPSSGFMNMYMYKLVIVLHSYRFLGR